jgi:dihydroneopterin aldolase
MSGSDRIILRGVRAWGHHGVLPAERANGQEFLVDLELGVASMDIPAASDDLVDTVDYAAAAAIVVELITGTPFDLIETLGVRIAEACLALRGVETVTVTVHKPSAPIPVPFSDVAIRVTRP